MKKTSLFLVAICLLFLSCEKTPVNEWDRFYGFSKDDIVGHYEANPDESLYQDLPTPGVTVYNNATIDITPLSDNAISIRLVIPSVINKVFSGAFNNDEESSDLVLRNFNEDIMVTVYRNDKGQIRLHGREKRYRYDADGNLVDSNYYGFDVIKSTEE